MVKQNEKKIRKNIQMFENINILYLFVYYFCTVGTSAFKIKADQLSNFPYKTCQKRKNA